MSKLVEHAERELGIINEDPEHAETIRAMVVLFAKLRPSGGQAEVLIGQLSQLLQFKNLAPLTDDPEEWLYHSPETWEGDPEGPGVHQSLRNSEAFSRDGGKTYYLVSDEFGPEGYVAKYETVRTTAGV